VPLERISKGFKDISMSFQINPLSNDLIALKNANAIARSVRNIIFTLPGEKMFNPDFGTNITDSLFELLDSTSASVVQDQIKYSLETFEPRISILDIIVTPNFNELGYDVEITYNIIGQEIDPQQISFILQSTR
jgi:phage baseplate assembly protein W|tara:strand:+ start:1604 stop:2005 length:402 start_codon:yes stop_codon:yes gene_type:complete